MFAQNRWGEGPKTLAILDLEIHYRLGLRRARIAEYRPRAQSPRPELHPTLEKSHDLTIGQVSGYPDRKLVVRQLLRNTPAGLQKAADLVKSLESEGVGQI